MAALSKASPALPKDRATLRSKAVSQNAMDVDWRPAVGVMDHAVGRLAAGDGHHEGVDDQLGVAPEPMAQPTQRRA